MSRALVAACLAMAASGCLETRTSAFRCDDGACEAGRTCVDGWCVEQGGGGGDSGPTADGATPDAPFECPPGCDRCEGTTCVFECATALACQELIACPPGTDCRMECGGGGACEGGIDCTAGGDCVIQCTGDGSCAGPITCSGGDCDVACSGSPSCTGGLDCSAACACDTACTGGGACAPQPVCVPGGPCSQGGDCRSGPGSCNSC